MGVEEHLRVVQFFLAVLVLWAWYVFMYKRTRTDRLREDLFTIRDELFDYMWQHELSYDLPAYQQMRDFLNGGIRFADQLNVIPLLLLSYLTRSVRYRKEYSLLSSINEIDDPTARAYFEEVYNKIGSRFFRRVFLEGVHWPLFKLIQLALRFGRLRNLRGNAQESQPVQAMSDELMRWGRRNSPEARSILMTLHTPMWRIRKHT